MGNFRTLTQAPVFRRMIAWLLAAAMACGCAAFEPRPLDENSFRSHSQTQVKQGVSVSAAVLGAEETEAAFGFALYEKGVQPVWLEIENNTPHRIWFTSVSIDKAYFSPLEVAYMHHFGRTQAARQKIDRFFHKYAIHRSIRPGMTQSGFVYTNIGMGTKAFNLDVISEHERMRTFTFVIPVAGLAVDHAQVDWKALYEDDEIVSVDSPAGIRKALEALPDVTTGMDGTMPADPINVVIIGDGQDILHSLLRSGWGETAASSSYDPVARLPWEFQYQPVKSLYLFDRPQDAAFRKSRSTLNERNQLRLWLSPLYYEGKNVWVGQISRIIRRAVWEQFVIAPDVDEARSYLLQDLWYAEALLKYGYIRKTEVATLAQPRKSLYDDDYFTDGLCLVAWVAGEPVSFSEVEFMPWETPPAERRRLLLGR